jgi:hexosaminidase
MNHNRFLRILSLILMIQLVACTGIISQVLPSLIPLPREVTMKEGKFELSTATIAIPADPAAQRVADYFTRAVQDAAGLKLRPGNSARPGNIRFEYDRNMKLPSEYAIHIDTGMIRIIAACDTGLFLAAQTLSQLIRSGAGDMGSVSPRTGSGGRADQSVQFDKITEGDSATGLIQKSSKTAGNGKVHSSHGMSESSTIPCMEIHDFPRYSWRSSMLDVGRHFLPVTFIKQHLDLLAFYKINIFHWHLTEDQGWRIEIKKYPELTRKGAWRKEADGSIYGGFYTQEEIREVVEYARERYITVVPEIEMPGHCLAALASYPELSCRTVPFEVAAHWGVLNDVYCAGQEETYAFLENVLDEVLELFPSPWIHIGGDEVPKYRWQNCPVCQARMKKEGLRDEHELQSWFIRRIEKYLSSKGRTMIGWDEILEGGVSSDAIIEVWRGEEKVKEALGNGNRIIQTLYLNTPPASLTLEQVFRFNPAVEGGAGLVLGADAPLWSENITEFNAHYMLWPRMQAFAEALWNGTNAFDDFYRRLEKHKRWMEAKGIVYGGEDRNLVSMQLKYLPAQNLWRITAQEGPKNLLLRYTFDGTTPATDSPAFSDSLTVDRPVAIAVIPYLNDHQVLSPVHFNITNHRALGKKADFTTPYHENYSQPGDWGLTDGIQGGWNFTDGTWLGWWGSDLEAVIDLGAPMTVASLSLTCMQQVQSWIMLPRKVMFQASVDGKNWHHAEEVTHRVPDDDLSPVIHPFSTVLPAGTRARYIRVKAVNYGKLPAWHNGAGGNAWIFADEIVVR